MLLLIYRFFVHVKQCMVM